MSAQPEDPVRPEGYYPTLVQDIPGEHFADIASTTLDVPPVQPELQSGIIENPFLIHQARKLVGRVYLKYGYVTPHQITKEGYVDESVDPHVADSVYFARPNDASESMLSTARLIRKGTLEDFPAVKEFSTVDPKKLAEIDSNPEHYREVSALVKAPEGGSMEDILHLYASMMKYSINNDVSRWLMSVDHKLVNRLHLLFGRRNFKKIGDTEFMMGSNTTPFVMDIQDSLQLYRYPHISKGIKKIFDEELKGVDPSKLTPKARRILERRGVIERTAESSRADKLERIATAGLVGYCLARAGVIPGTNLDEHGVNPWVFLGIDIATIPPYVRGLRIVGSQHSSRLKAAGGAALAGSAFMAPYGYMFAEAGLSEGVPQAVGIYAGMLMTSAAVKKYNSRHQTNHNE